MSDVKLQREQYAEAARQKEISDFEAEAGVGFEHSAQQLAEKEKIPLSVAMEKLAVQNPDSYNRHVERLRSTSRAPTPRERVKS